MKKAYIISDGTESFSVDAPVINQESNIVTIEPNVYNVFGKVDGLLKIIQGPRISDVANNYIFRFEAGVNVILDISTGAEIKWANGNVPSLIEGNIYEITIIDNCAIYTLYS